MARIYRHGSFLFFVYVCVTSLLCMLGFGNIGIAGFWKRLFTVSFEVLVGAGVTIFFIDRLNAHRERESLKRRLIREAGSRSQDIAISAVEWMDREGWLRGEDGSFEGGEFARGPVARGAIRRSESRRCEFGGLPICEAQRLDWTRNLTCANLFRVSAKVETLYVDGSEI